MTSFTKQSAVRVGNATLIVERMTRNPRTKGERAPVVTGRSFLAKITATDGSGKYSWIAMEPNEDDEIEEQEDNGTGDHTEEEGYAVEARYKSEHVLIDEIVRLWPAKNQEYYLFEYQPTLKVGKLVAGTISARSSNTPGSGTITLQDYDGTSFSDGDELDVLNPFNEEVGDGTGDYAVEVEYGDGYWWITAATCGEL